MKSTRLWTKTPFQILFYSPNLKNSSKKCLKNGLIWLIWARKFSKFLDPIGAGGGHYVFTFSLKKRGFLKIEQFVGTISWLLIGPNEFIGTKCWNYVTMNRTIFWNKFWNENVEDHRGSSAKKGRQSSTSRMRRPASRLKFDWLVAAPELIHSKQISARETKTDVVRSGRHWSTSL